MDPFTRIRRATECQKEEFRWQKKRWYRLEIQNVCFIDTFPVPPSEDSSSMIPYAVSVLKDLELSCLYYWRNKHWPVTISFLHMNSKFLWIWNCPFFFFFTYLKENHNMNPVSKPKLVLQHMLSPNQFHTKCPRRCSTWGIRAAMESQN